MNQPNSLSDKQIRVRWYLAVDREKKSVAEICWTFGISRKTYYKWRKRDFRGGGKTYQSERPHPHLKLTKELREFIEKHKFISNYGPLKMKMFVKKKLNIDISTTIIYRYYQRRKLIRKPQKKYQWYQPMKQKLSVFRPGEGVQVDVKYVYTNRGKRQFQFSFLDVFTKKYYFEVFDTRHSRNAIVAHQNAEKYFGFGIVSVQTDNGSEFRGSYHGWLTQNNILHFFIPKSSPNWNPNVERIHKTIDDEFYQNPMRIWKTPMEWLKYYNFQRIHLSLNGLTPQEKLKSVTLDC
jgi:transposase